MKETGAPMHTGQGAGYQSFKYTQSELGKIDFGGNNLRETIQEVHQDILHFMRNMEQLKKKQQAFKMRATVLRNAIHTGKEKEKDVS
jgi:predicted RNase H-like nuclease